MLGLQVGVATKSFSYGLCDLIADPHACRTSACTHWAIIFPISTLDIHIHLPWKMSWIGNRTWWHPTAAHKHLQRRRQALLEKAHALLQQYFSFSKGAFLCSVVFQKVLLKYAGSSIAMQVPQTYNIFPIYWHGFSLLLQVYGDLKWVELYIRIRINSSLWKGQLISCQQSYLSKSSGWGRRWRNWSEVNSLWRI